MRGKIIMTQFPKNETFFANILTPSGEKYKINTKFTSNGLAYILYKNDTLNKQHWNRVAKASSCDKLLKNIK